MSRVGAPSVIHSASARPAPGAKMIPWLLNPAATYRPATAPVSPRQNAASGVNDSGAFRNFAYSTPRSAGTRSSASRRTGAKCSQSGSSSPNAKSAGNEARIERLAVRLERPHQQRAVSRAARRSTRRGRGSRADRPSRRRSARVRTCTCAAGHSGTVRPPSAARSRVQSPHASTTRSHAIAALLRVHRRSRGRRLHRSPWTPTPSRNVTPRACAPSASASAARPGLTWPSSGWWRPPTTPSATASAEQLGHAFGRRSSSAGMPAWRQTPAR